MKVLVDSLKNHKNTTQAVLCFATQSIDKKGKKVPKITGCDKSIVEVVKDASLEGAFSGNKNELLVVRNANCEHFKHLVVVGLGEKNIDNETLRSATGIAYKAFKANHIKQVAFMLDSALVKSKDAAYSTQAMVEGFVLSSYTFDEYMAAKDKDHSPKPDSLTVYYNKKGSPAAIKKAADAGNIIAEATNWAKTLGDTPGNLMTPDILAKTAQKALKGTKAKITVWDKARIKKERFGGLMGVSLGSTEEPRFIIIEYNGAAKSKKPLAFVGKGLTFDCGGISIKPSASMEEMKYDMCGGANVLGAMVAIARLGLKVNIRCYVPATENMPGPAATKPGDILTFRNGKTCHVDNTDAEGRLILADALSYASEFKPAAIVDAATLTGAVLVALGNTHTGVMGRDNKMVKKIQEASKTTGEKVWQLPIDETHITDMHGTFADLNNIGVGRFSGSQRAGAFLSYFVDEDIPWVHCDIAGTAWDTAGRLTYTQPKLASGAMVRTFVQLAQNWK